MAARARRFALLFVLCALTRTGAARAEPPTIALDLAPDRTVPGQPVRATVTITGGSQGLAVTLPAPGAVTVRRAGTSRNIQFINGEMSSSVQYFFQLEAANPGTYQIGPAEARERGSVYTSAPATLTVGAAGRRENDRTGVFAEATVDNQHPYVGEQVTYTFRLFRPRDIAIQNAKFEWPETEGLWEEALDAATDELTEVNGHAYIVHTLKRAYFPTRAGEATIGPASVTYQQVVRSGRRSPFGFFDDSIFDMFSGRVVTQRGSAPSITLAVRALPPAPAEAQSETPLVGSFALRASISDTEVRVGDSITLNVEVVGAGNVRAAPSLAPHDLDNAKVYPDQPEVTVQATGAAVEGVVRQRVAIVPQRVGTVRIPPLRVAAFDPTAGEWTTLTSPAFEIHAQSGDREQDVVAGASARQTPPAPRDSIQALATDLLAPHPVAGQDPRLPQPHDRVVRLLVVALPPLVFGAAVVARRRADRYAADPTFLRRRRAGRTARAALRGLGSGDAEQVCAVLTDYVADRIGAPRGAVTGQEAVALIREVDGSLADQAEGLVRAGEAAKYGGLADATADIAAALALVDGLERVRLEEQAQHA